MKVLTTEEQLAAITEVILNHPQHMDFTEKVEFAREIEAMVLKEVFKRIQPEGRNGNV